MTPHHRLYFSFLLAGFCLLGLASCERSDARAEQSHGNSKSKVSAANSDTVEDTEPESTEASLTRDPYLQLATPNSIYVVWRTRAGDNPVLKYGSEAGNYTHSISHGKGISVRRLAKEGGGDPGSRPLHSAPSRTRQYEAHITGLKPDTLYYYAVFDGDKKLTEDDSGHYFRTHPTPGTERNTWIWVAGDGGTGGRSQAAVHHAMMEFTKNSNITLDLFAHVGDMAYSSGLDSEFQGKFFEMYSATLRNTVCWAAMGNHEGITSKGLDGIGPYYDAYICPTKGEAGGVPSGREAYYSFDYGRTHFIVLDSCQEALHKSRTLTDLGKAMMEWLKADLEKTQADWLIVYFHHPPYTKGSHDSDIQGDYESIVMREQFMPVLESAGVDLVLSGHSHIYERSMLIDGAYATPTTAANVVIDDGDGDPNGDGPYKKNPGLNPNDGAIYVVTGNAGTGLRRVGTMPVMKRIILEHGSVLLNIKGDTLTGLMLNRDGERKDVFQISKKEKIGARTKIASPKPPPPMPEVRSVRGEGKGEDSKVSPSAGLPEDFTELVPRHAEWKYYLGKPDSAWTQAAFDDQLWSTGKAGFGYADNDDTTIVQMRSKHPTLYLRRKFTLTGNEDLSKLGLAICYDDAFILYLNGHEVARSENITGTGSKIAVSEAHEAGSKFEFFKLDKAAGFLKQGDNIIAIEGHNDDLDSSDFTLNPLLILTK